ncbi:TIGR03086 family metal-binding protein [Flindersiella endophytica]
MPTNYPASQDLVDLDAKAVRTSVDLVAKITDQDLDRLTPCRGWTLYGLLAHMTTQHHGFASSARGEADLALWRTRSLGDDPVATYRAAAHDVLAAFAADDLADRKVVLPEFSLTMTLPALQAVGFHLVDYVVHAWDVARALDLPVDFDDDVLEAALGIAKAVPNDDASRLAPGAAFAPAVESSGGSTLDEIVALLGRSPAWPR